MMRLIVVALVAGLALLPAAALANGAPVKITLERLAGIVNYGPDEARGEAEITIVEGDAAVRVTGLPRLTNELYQSWLVNTRTGDRLSIGKFNSTADGTAQVRSVVGIGNREFDLFVITVEPEPDPSVEADPRIVLAGYWPGKAPEAVIVATATALAQIVQAVTPAATIVSTAQPTGLPRTGAPGFEILLGGLALLGAGALMLGRGIRR